MKSLDYMNFLVDAAKSSDKKAIDIAVNVIRDAVEAGKTVFTCGNGGSASTASHYVTDWSKMRLVNKSKPFKAYCLSDNIGMLTAYANDLSYENIFDQSLLNYSREGDILILVSGSGNSKNLINAAHKATELGVITIGVLGFDGGVLKTLCDYNVHFEVNDMQIAEDLHLSFGHIVMKAICC